MEELRKKLTHLKQDLNSTLGSVGFDSKYQKLQEMTRTSLDPHFWDDSDKAQKHMQFLGSLQSEVDPWQALKLQLDETIELSELDDQTLHNDLEETYQTIKKAYTNLKKDLRFRGEYDNKNALLSIYAGAGGTDAQDWAAMLLRMYTRWAENNQLKATVLEESAGEEAGIKSVSLELRGSYVYGKLKAEHGVHRLVRLSPFNADAKRQTSFAKVEVMPEIDSPEDVPIDEADLKIDVFRAGGHGGQSVNTTDSAVRVTHVPTGVVVSIQNERSQLQNKETALTILRSKLIQLKEEQHLETLSEIKGPNQSAEWGNQIRSYVLHPYTMVKDLRTRHETANAQAVLDGDLNPFIDSFLEQNIYL